MIPVTVLSGFLGAGKTALRNHILQHARGLRVGVLVNDLEAGCFCCTRRAELQHEVERLANEERFDYLLIETGGLGEPLPVAEALADLVRLDTLVTVIDAANFLRDYQEADYLHDRGLAQAAEDDRTVVDLLIEQVEFADAIVLNKCDLVESRERDRLEAILHYLNPNATLLRAEFGQVPVEQVLNTHRFDYERTIQEPGWLQVLRGDLAESGEFGVGSFIYRAQRPFHPERFWHWLQQGQAGVLRARGLFWLATRPEQAGLWLQAGGACWLESAGQWQNAPSVMDLPVDPVEGCGDRRQELVFIGIHLDRAALSEALDACLLTAAEFASGGLDWAGLPDQFGDWDTGDHD